MARVYMSLNWYFSSKKKKLEHIKKFISALRSTRYRHTDSISYDELLMMHYLHHYPYVGYYSSYSDDVGLGKNPRRHLRYGGNVIGNFLAYSYRAAALLYAECAINNIACSLESRDIGGVDIWYCNVRGKRSVFYILDTLGKGNGLFDVPVSIGDFVFLYTDSLADYLALDLSSDNKIFSSINLITYVNDYKIFPRFDKGIWRDSRRTERGKIIALHVTPGNRRLV